MAAAWFALNGAKHIVLAYTDGIDNCFVLESQVPFDEFRLLPALQDSHTVAHLEDGGVGHYLFYDEGIRFLVVGRETLGGLERFAKDLYRMALDR